MKRWTSLCKIELKRSAKILPWLFLRTAKVVFVVILLCAVISEASGREVFRKMKIAIVAEEAGKQEELILATFNNMESVNSLCAVAEMSEEDAKEALKAGELGAAVFLPKNYVNDIRYGKKTPAVIRFSPQSTLNSVVLRTVADSGAGMLTTAQAAISALSEAAYRHPTEVDSNKMAYDVSLSYLAIALAREDLFAEERVSMFYNRTGLEYYGAVLVLVLTFVSLISCAALYSDEDRNVKRYLYGRGMSAAGTVAAENLGVMLLTAVAYGFWLVTFRIAGRVTGLAGEGFLSMNPLAAGAIVLSMSAFAHMLLSLFRKDGRGGQAMLLALGLMVMLGGGVAPLATLPPLAGIAGSALPFRYWVEALLAEGRAPLSALLVLMLWAAAAWLMSAAGEKRRLKNG